MQLFKSKDKGYVVTIISNNNKQEVQVKAKNKNSATEMVINVLLKCDLFGIKSLDDIKLECRRIRREV